MEEYMRRIIIQNFGPISSIDLLLDKSLNVIIGAQASGKSTLAKTIYFCRKTRDYLVGFYLIQVTLTFIQMNNIFLF